MPIHSLATIFGETDGSQLFFGAATLATVVGVKAWAGGRKCTWERDWAGKMIMIVARPTPVILSLIDHLLQLPSPPQILFLPPYPSPLPDSLLTLLHTIRIGTTNPLAQLHCEPLPATPRSVRDFAQKWAKALVGMAGEGGRRTDAIVLGSGWEVAPDLPGKPDQTDDPPWSTQQFHYHLLTSLLPHFLQQPAERNIRIISLVSPTWSSALPSLTRTAPAITSPFQLAGSKSLQTLLLMSHFQLILDTLASSLFSSSRSIPTPDGEVRKRDKAMQSNVMAISVVMGWARAEVICGALGAKTAWLNWYITLYPLIMLLTPSPSRAIQPILFALQAPVRYGPLDLEPRPLPPPTADVAEGFEKRKGEEEPLDPRRSSVRGGDVVRDCAIVDLPPVLRDPALCRAAYDALEKEVEKGVKESAAERKQPENNQR